MFNERRLFAFWVVTTAIWFGLIGVAAAQTVTLPNTGVSHSRTTRGDLRLNQVNYRDCAENDTISFSLSLANRSTHTLEVWSGQDCETLANRTTPTLTLCRKVHSQLPTSNQPTATVKVQDMLYFRTQASGGTSGTGTAGSSAGGSSGSGGDASTSGGTSGGGGETSGGGGVAGSGTAGTSAAGATSTGTIPACTLLTPNPTAQTITLFFMLVDGSSTIQGTTAKYIVNFKLLASPPPTNVEAGIGETISPITFTGLDTADMSVQGYRFYCDPPPGIEAAEAANLVPEPGAPLEDCVASDAVKAGVIPDERYYCGSAERTSSKGNATGLVNGVAYNVAVATTDIFFNTGVLSSVACAHPQPVTGFYEAYRDAGGRGGGGFCAFSRHGEPLILLSVLGIGSCLVLRRRRAT